MIRLIALCLTAILLTKSSNGQELQKTKFQRFGFTIGGNYAKMNFNKDYPTDATSGKIIAKPGFLIGFILRVPLSKKLTLRPEYTYSERSSEVKSSHTTYKLNYFSTPLFLSYHVSDRISIIAGPQLDLLLKATSIARDTSANITHTTEERGLGATVGISYRLTRLLQVEAQYYHGLSHVGIQDNTTEFKYSVFRLNMSFNF